MLDAIKKPIAEIVTRPSDRWKNWYRLLDEIMLARDGACIQDAKAGEAFCTDGVYPSKELAEQAHIKNASNHMHCTRQGVAEYIGALPE